MKNHIVIRIIHGSIPHKQFKDDPKELGGKRGGHVAIQIDNHIYGFYYADRNNIHIFSHKKSKNCIFQKQTIKEWATIIKDKKETSIFIPVTKEEKKFLLNFYRENLKNPSYDYSFFGQRCASSCYLILKEIKKIDGGRYFLNAFYPGQFRKKMLKQAAVSGYKVYVKQGPPQRIWEGDRI